MGLMTRYALPRSREAVFPSFRTQIARYGYLRAEQRETVFDFLVVCTGAVRFVRLGVRFMSWRL